MKRNAHAIQARRDEIRNRVWNAGSISVFEMSRHFDVSESTIRRDLEAIEDGNVVRFHGGMEKNAKSRDFEEKAIANAAAKEAIAEKAAAMIQNGQTIFMNAGTTTLALFRKILFLDLEIFVITNNAAAICECDTCRADLMLLGGTYQARSRSLAGGMAIDNLAVAYADICFLGANGVSLERGLTSFVHMDAEIVGAMAARAGKTVCIVDSSKLSVDAGFTALPLTKLTTLITDSGADPVILDKLRSKNMHSQGACSAFPPKRLLTFKTWQG